MRSSIDIVIPFIHSRWQDTELRFCLRSIEKHLSNVRNVFIIGDKPALKNIIHIPYEKAPTPLYKERNILKKLMVACEDQRVSNQMIYVNDDHFLLDNYDAETFPNYYSSWPVRANTYGITLENTKRVIKGAKFYDVHCPILIDKERFKQRMALFNWDTPGGYCMKTLYAHGLTADENYEDQKIRVQYPIEELRGMIKGRKWFSVCDGARGPQLLQLLNELYPNKSRYE